MIAARWVAPDAVAAPLLDRFERHLRCLPRDVALREALRDLCRGAPGVPADALGVPADDLPAAYWACWTLYGDAGRQTGAGPVRRRLRRLNERIRRAAHR